MNLYDFQSNPIKVTFPGDISLYLGPKTYWIGSHRDSGSLVALHTSPTRESFPDIERYSWREVVEFEEQK